MTEAKAPVFLCALSWGGFHLSLQMAQQERLQIKSPNVEVEKNNSQNALWIAAQSH